MRALGVDWKLADVASPAHIEFCLIYSIPLQPLLIEVSSNCLLFELQHLLDEPLHAVFPTIELVALAQLGIVAYDFVSDGARHMMLVGEGLVPLHRLILTGRLDDRLEVRVNHEWCLRQVTKVIKKEMVNRLKLLQKIMRGGNSDDYFR